MNDAARLPILALLVAALAPSGARATDTRVALPDGFVLSSGTGVATERGRHALLLSEPGRTTASRVLQVAAGAEVFTDLEGLADRVEYSADGTHLLVRQTLPDAAAPRYSLIDRAGEIVWSATSPAAYRFTAGGNLLYVAQYPGDATHIRVFDLRGNLLRAVEPPRPYLDARVLDDGLEALVLFSAPRSRSAGQPAGREVSLERVRLEPGMPTVWHVGLDQDALQYPELVPVNRDWVLITTTTGFVAVDRNGAATRHGTEGQPFDAALATGLADLQWSAADDDGTLVLPGPGRALAVNLASGERVAVTADADSRFDAVGYTDGQVVIERPGEVILKPLDDPLARPAASRSRKR